MRICIIDEAVKRGASLVTHLGNGCTTNIHRFNNPLWSFLNHEKLKAGFIADCFGRSKELPRLAEGKWSVHP